MGVSQDTIDKLRHQLMAMYSISEEEAGMKLNEMFKESGFNMESWDKEPVPVQSVDANSGKYGDIITAAIIQIYQTMVVLTLHGVEESKMKEMRNEIIKAMKNLPVRKP